MLGRMGRLLNRLSDAGLGVALAEVYVLLVFLSSASMAQRHVALCIFTFFSVCTLTPADAEDGM